jgi:non-heme chloroperoxidase
MRSLLKHFRVPALAKAAVGITLLFPLGASYAQRSNKPPECLETSTPPPKTWFVTVAPDVQLQVLDWGGSGEAMVFLTGLGDSAHVYDDFAWQFTDYFHVIGITRRGYGSSSKPETGYDLPTRVADDIAVLKAFNISKAVFVGHSISGDELSALGASSPDLVDKLVYLDALDFYAHSHLPALPPQPYTDADARSLKTYTAASARFLGVRTPIADQCEILDFGPSGEVLGTNTPASINIEGALTEPADYQDIQAPRLGIFAPLFLDLRAPYYFYLSPADQAQFDSVWPAYVAWQQDAIQRFSSHAPNSPAPIVFTLPLREPVANEPAIIAYHYVFINSEAFVVQQMRAFLGIPFVPSGATEGAGSVSEGEGPGSPTE